MIYDEFNEEISITLANATNASIGTTTSATRTIEDDDDAPSISISVDAVTEGNDTSTNANMVFTVEIDQQSFKDISVNYATTTRGNSRV